MELQYPNDTLLASSRPTGLQGRYKVKAASIELGLSLCLRGLFSWGFP